MPGSIDIWQTFRDEWTAVGRLRPGVHAGGLRDASSEITDAADEYWDPP